MSSGENREWMKEFLELLNRLRGADPHDIEARFLDHCCSHRHGSRSQLFQDLFVLFALDGLEGGYFVEFGACDGVMLSNTLMLEREKGWTGILAEPGRSWHRELAQNRTCAIDYRCVYSDSKAQVSFRETAIPEISSLEEFAHRDRIAQARRDGEVYMVETVSLNDLLHDHGAPPHINYMSVDTEGSELRILERFDFARYAVDVWTIEHNFSADRENIRDLMARNGYVNVFPRLSSVDDWYVRPGVWEQLFRPAR